MIETAHNTPCILRLESHYTKLFLFKILREYECISVKKGEIYLHYALSQRHKFAQNQPESVVA